MDIRIESRPVGKAKADRVIVGVFEASDHKKFLSRFRKIVPVEMMTGLDECIADEDFLGRAGQKLDLPTYGNFPCKRLLLWGLGKSDYYSDSLVRKATANMARYLASRGNNASISIYLEEKGDARSLVQAATEGLVLGSYSFTKYKSDKKGGGRDQLKSVSVGGVNLKKSDFDAAVKSGKAIGEATNMARNWIAEPASFMTPSRLAREAVKIGGKSGISVAVLNSKQVEKLGMGCFTGVARGADEPLRFIAMKYTRTKAKKTVCLVGKGITFDSGGLSLKTAEGMERMKYDMAGAAAVIATMQAVGVLKPRVSVLAVVATTENMPGASALHPGDVLTAMNGKTVEVNNTDAEGRLILADALSWACKQKPDEIIDVATLTGACVVALGRVAAAVMGNNQELVDSLVSAGCRAGEKLWQLPLFEEYRETLKSDIADLKNAGSKGEAGSASAGMFLQEFVDGRPWAHIDIAGVGWLNRARDECSKGGTGFGVRTFCHYLMSEK